MRIVSKRHFVRRFRDNPIASRWCTQLHTMTARRDHVDVRAAAHGERAGQLSAAALRTRNAIIESRISKAIELSRMIELS